MLHLMGSELESASRERTLTEARCRLGVAVAGGDRVIVAD